jgi:hypothetical protein
MILCGLSLISAFPLDHPTDDKHVDKFVRETVNKWRKWYGNDPDLQVALIDVKFRKEPQFFTAAEGVVISPVGIDLQGSQKIIEIASYPPFLRKLTTEGITSLSWEYAGTVNRDLRYVALTLVRRDKKKTPEAAAWPTYDSLPADLRAEALATADDLDEHGLHKCADFADWVKNVAGEPPYTEQFLCIVRALGAAIDNSEDAKNDDICAAMRAGKFTVHRAHVLAVMAARQMKIPAFGFASASPKQIHLVGIYTDQEGWLLVDLENCEKGYFSGGPVLLTKVPLISPFEGSRHQFWYPEGAAYSKNCWSSIFCLSETQWLGRQEPSDLTNTTEARSFPLQELDK